MKDDLGQTSEASATLGLGDSVRVFERGACANNDILKVDIYSTTKQKWSYLWSLTRVSQTPPPAPTKQSALEYKVFDITLADAGKTEIVSVVVRPGIKDDELIAIATEVHKLHPKSDIFSFYDKADSPNVKQYWKCISQIMKKIDDPQCPNDFNAWESAHKVGSLSSFYDSPSRTSKRWILSGKMSVDKIAALGIDDRP